MHECLYDCCAAVRQSLAEALFHASSQTSVAPLRELLRQENDPELRERSATVAKYARVALGRCGTRVSFRSPPGRGLLIVISADIDFVCNLAQCADERGLHLHQSHTAIDLIAIDARAQIVDPALCTAEDWDAFLEYLRELAECGEPDVTPLLLMNTTSQRAMEHPNEVLKPAGSLTLYGPGCTEQAMATLRDVLG